MLNKIIFCKSVIGFVMTIAFPFTIPMSMMVGAVPVLTALTFSA